MILLSQQHRPPGQPHISSPIVPAFQNQDAFNMNIAELTQQLQNERQLRQEEMKRRQEAEKSQQEEKERRQEAEKREQKAEKREQKAEKSRQEEKKRRQKAEKRRQEEKKRRQEAEKRLQDEQRRHEEQRGLSWREGLSLWKTIYANPEIPFRHTNPPPASTFTKPTGRQYPKYLRHWTQFHSLHKEAFEQVSNELDQPEAQAFPPRKHYQDMAQAFMSTCVLGNKAQLVAYEERSVEALVTDAWKRKGNDIIGFEMPSSHFLQHINDGRAHSPKRPASNPPTTQSAESKRQYDKMCYITPKDGKRRKVCVLEYKSADKLTPEVVEGGLHDMEIEQVIQRVKLSRDKDTRKKEVMEDVIAAVITQTFDYMVDNGLSYGYATGGSAFIFLFTSPDNPQVLFYEKVILEQASNISSIDSDATLRLSAVGLVAGFVQMALGGQVWSKRLRRKALKELPIWEINEKKIPKDLSPTRTLLRNKSHKYKNNIFLVSSHSPKIEEPDNHSFPPTSPAVTRATKKRKIETGCRESNRVLHQSPKDDDSSGGQSRIPQGIAGSSVIQSAPNSGQKTTEAKERKYSSNSQGQKRAAAEMCSDLEANIARPDRPYCTQACLLGLIRGHFLDKKCPNVRAHQMSGRDYSRNAGQQSQQQRKNRHALDQQTLARLLDEQLQRAERDDNGGIESLDRSGWAGALFRLELLSHGYTFVGKGTVEPLISVLQIEADMYKRMDTIQGKAIPVYLGNIDLKPPFRLTTRVAIVNLMLLSWGGEEGWQCGIDPDRLWLETLRTHYEVVALGVQQGDLRDPNILWNFELDRAFLIDFEFAHIEEAQDVIETVIAEGAEVKKELKLLGQISG